MQAATAPGHPAHVAPTNCLLSLNRSVTLAATGPPRRSRMPVFAHVVQADCARSVRSFAEAAPFVETDPSATRHVAGSKDGGGGDGAAAGGVGGGADGGGDG